MSAVLLELQALRREVRELKRLEQEVSDLRQQLARVQQCTGRCAVDGTISNYDFPPLIGADSAPEPVARTSDNGKYSQLAKELHATGLTIVRSRHAQSEKEHVVGSSTSNKHVSSVTTTRVVDMFVSRLHPLTAVSEVEECAKSIAGKDINIIGVRCSKLKARYEHLYASMHVKISVTAADFKCALDIFMKMESWPVGMFVKHYFKPRIDNGESQPS